MLNKNIFMKILETINKASLESGVIYNTSDLVIANEMPSCQPYCNPGPNSGGGTK